MKKIKVTNHYLDFFIDYFVVFPNEVCALIHNNFDSNNEATVKETISRYSEEAYNSARPSCLTAASTSFLFLRTISLT